MIPFSMQRNLQFITMPPTADVTRAFPQLKTMRKTTVRLHPVPCNDIPLHASKIGGEFLWPENDPWPTSDDPQAPYCEVEHIADKIIFHERKLHNKSFAGVLQLRRDDVPELGFPPGKDLFQLLWNPRDHLKPHYGPLTKVFWRKAADICSSPIQNPKPEYPGEGYVPKPCAVHPERVDEFPAPHELPDDLRQELHEWEKLIGGDTDYQFLLSNAPGIKIGGYPGWLQEAVELSCDHCAQKMEFIVDIEGCEFDGGSGPRWRPEVSGIDYDPLPNPTELNIVRDGALHLFICRRCPGWPCKYVVEMQ